MVVLHYLLARQQDQDEPEGTFTDVLDGPKYLMKDSLMREEGAAEGIPRENRFRGAEPAGRMAVGLRRGMMIERRRRERPVVAGPSSDERRESGNSAVKVL